MVTWRPATVAAVRAETSNARTLVLEVDEWPGHLPGQHVDVRLTAEDGYTAVRSYSIASSGASKRLEITVDELVDGEVSPYLVEGASVGDRFEVRGPAGGWFVWRAPELAADVAHGVAPDSTVDVPRHPVQLIGGGSGVVPLMAMVRTHGDLDSSTPFRLLYSVRSPELALFHEELTERQTDDAALAITWAYTRSVPAGWPHLPARLTREAVLDAVFAPEVGAEFFICGSTPFVERIANWLVDAGHDPARIKTERFGGIGGAQ